MDVQYRAGSETETMFKPGLIVGHLDGHMRYCYVVFQPRNGRNGTSEEVLL